MEEINNRWMDMYERNLTHIQPQQRLLRRGGMKEQIIEQGLNLSGS